MISFIVPAYNEEALIGRTLESLNKAAAQIGEPYEIVVANDGSTDRTAAIAESHGLESLPSIAGRSPQPGMRAHASQSATN